MKKSVISVIGSTATGKSDLAVHLAKLFKGEVINADSMQVYKGLDVITNKISESDKRGVNHHLMSFLDRDKEYAIPHFMADSTSLINSMAENDILPVVAGGTHYYIHHLLFANKLIKNESPASRSLPDVPSPSYVDIISVLSENDQKLAMKLPEINEADYEASDERGVPLYARLHSILSQIDPPAASRWHIRDFRKVKRSLEIIWEHGKRRSDIENEQKAQQDDSLLQTRYKNLVFWVYTDPEVLSKRLERRVEKMTEQGLLNEIEEMRALENEFRVGGEQDYTRGIFQAIGYKEFDAYFKATNSQDRDVAFKNGLELMKIATRQYATKQLKWIQNKLIPEILAHQEGAQKVGNPSSVYVYMVDSSDISQWDERVTKPASEILEKFLKDDTLPDPRSYSETANKLFAKQSLQAVSNAERGYRKVICEVCTTDPHNPVMLGEGLEYENHLRSKAHKAKTRPKATRPSEAEIARLRALKNR
ncbi:hypothetical protein E3Q23_01081 [Wallemia mellicola]|nr:hypothetical protein E3Q23_01081 [Wallemia mellicola]TIC29562.1 tRNA isopentenyltransferase [Wallemia mellicola]TIC75091.1 tRNA isopentenyltransferase [Wallemia mellicola]